MKEESNHDLPHELVLQIFSKLPVRSLCRFKCVSKPLHSSIKDPIFMEKSKPGGPIQWQVVLEGDLYIYSIDDSVNELSTPMRKFDLGGKIPFSRSSNGLLCYLDGNKYTLFNPTTAKSIALPAGYNLFEFGFDPISKKYKVVGWKWNPKAVHLEMAILTLDENRSWEPINNTTFVSSCCPFGLFATSADGFLFWLVENEQHVIFLNLGSHEFGLVNLPCQINEEDESEYCLFEFDQGHLCLAELNYLYKPRCQFKILNLWMLMDIVGSVWLTMMTNVAPFCNNPEYVDRLFKCVMFAERTGELFMKAWDIKGAHIFSYSLLNGKSKTLMLKAFPRSCMDSLVKHVENHHNIEELVPP